MAKLRAITQPLPLAKLAYQALRDSILKGQLVPGELYNEMALAKELGISRTPVREALLELASQGLVTYLPRKGVMVKHYTRRDVEEIFELRKAIELTAIEKVATTSPLPDLSALEKSLESQRKAWKRRDSDGYIRFDRTFHLAFCEMIGNRRFVSILDNIRDLIHLMAVRALSKEGRAEEVLREHSRVIKAVKKGDANGAKKAMDYHLERSKEAVLEHLNPDGEVNSRNSSKENQK